MEEHFDLGPHNRADQWTEDPDRRSAERIGLWAVGIAAIGFAVFVALCLVAGGIVVLRWAL